MISRRFSEADVLQDWSQSEDWRGDVRYAALVSKVIMDHQKQLVEERNVKIETVSGDNCFLNYHPYYFTQRTLLVRSEQRMRVLSQVGNQTRT